MRSIQSEHYFKCYEMDNLWNVRAEDMNSDDKMTLIRSGKFMEGVEKRNVRYQYGQLIQ